MADDHEFDFWLGTWDVTWGDNGRGTNQIKRILNGHVIEEHFRGSDPALEGISHSVLSEEDSRWHQTWVDDSGGYLDFVGEFADGRMILSRDGIAQGKPVRQRMVWYDIAENTLEWNWERSDDEGKTWKVLWNIHYKRTA